MIIYDLKCLKKHKFEGWFQNAEAFKEQVSNGMVECPKCGSRDITMEWSIGGVVKSSNLEKSTAPNPAAAARQFIENNFDDVGDRFCAEAIRMKNGHSEKRNIRGKMTGAEEKTLEKEKIRFFKVALPKLDD